MDLSVKPIDKNSAPNNNSSNWDRWQRFVLTSNVDKKQTESIRYRQEIGKSAEEIKKEREKMLKKGKDAFFLTLKESMKKGDQGPISGGV